VIKENREFASAFIMSFVKQLLKHNILQTAFGEDALSKTQMFN
jgi:hypothetical protein